MSRQLLRSFSSSAAARLNPLPGNQVYITAAGRTAIGKLFGGLKSVSAPELGSVVTKAVIERSKIPAEEYTDLIFGNVLQANVGQSPARQVVIKSGLPETTEALTVNKVCASGLKAVALASQSIQLGEHELEIAGGMESMSNSPYYVPRGLGPFGHQTAVDSIIKDGLWDVYNDFHMGNCCENTNEREGISRADQDAYAVESYKRALRAIESGVFRDEIIPVPIKSRKGETLFLQDEEPGAVKFDKIPQLKPVFKKDGTVTAANASSLNDGAAAVTLASEAYLKAHPGTPVMARVIAYQDAATFPVDFTIAPSLAIPKLLQKAGLQIEDVAKWEINEAFAGVSVANLRRLGLDSVAERVNANGGAVALGHPIGASGARILVSLLHELKDGEFGVAAICNGGGAASSLLVQKVSSV